MKKIYLLITVLIIIGVASSISWSSNQTCRQWEGKHQQFICVVIDGHVYAECGSCGERLPLREKYNGPAISVSELIKKMTE